MKITIEFEREFTEQAEVQSFMETLVGIQGDKPKVKVQEVILDDKKEAKAEKVSKDQPEEIEKVEVVKEEKKSTQYSLDDAKRIAKEKIRSHRAEIEAILNSLGAARVTDLTNQEEINTFVQQAQSLE